jgi:two-component system, NtrC family, response regulator AtoC
MPTVLIVDDEETHSRALARFLGRRGYATTVATSAAEGRNALAVSRPDVVLLDQRLGDDDGVTVLREAHGSDPDLPVIMMTAYGSVDTAVAAMKAGARDYIQKPIDLEQLALVIERALAEARAQACLDRMQRPALGTANGPAVLGTSAAMQPVHGLLARMARLEHLPAGEHPTVLLLGETGTGKSLVARALHQTSPLARAPFLVFDCTVVPRDLMEAELFGFERGAFTDAKAAKPGLVEVAAGGTLFLDEIGELGPAAQAKLLRVLEERVVRRLGALADVTVDVRIVAATNRNLVDEVAAGRLRQDLFYRLNVMTLTLPPLRERTDDIELLAEHYLQVYARKYGHALKTLTPDALAVLQAGRWVGNVRELAHTLERAVLMVDGDVIAAHHLGIDVGGSLPGEEEPATVALDEAERRLIRRVLEESGGNVSLAARRLGVSRELLRYRKRKHGIG